MVKMPQITPRDLNFLMTDSDCAEVAMSISRVWPCPTVSCLLLARRLSRGCHLTGNSRRLMWLTGWLAPDGVQLLSAQIIGSKHLLGQRGNITGTQDKGPASTLQVMLDLPISLHSNLNNAADTLKHFIVILNMSIICTCHLFKYSRKISQI